MKKGWLVIGALMGCVAGASLGACGSSVGGAGGGSTGGGATTSPTTSSSSGSLATSSSSGSSTTSSSGATSSSSSSSSGTGGSAPDAGPCGKITKLHPPSPDAGANTLFCPFSGVDGGKDEFCTAQTEHCCEPPASAMTPSTCDPIATPCATGDTDWQCEDPVADCPSGMECCAPGASIGISADPMCGNFAHKFHGTQCVAAGTCMGIQMCTSDSECPSGKTCVPFATKGNAVGGCN